MINKNVLFPVDTKRYVLFSADRTSLIRLCARASLVGLHESLLPSSGQTGSGTFYFY